MQQRGITRSFSYVLAYLGWTIFFFFYFSLWLWKCIFTRWKLEGNDACFINKKIGFNYERKEVYISIEYILKVRILTFRGYDRIVLIRKTPKSDKAFKEQRNRTKCNLWNLRISEIQINWIEECTFCFNYLLLFLSVLCIKSS